MTLYKGRRKVFTDYVGVALTTSPRSCYPLPRDRAVYWWGDLSRYLSPCLIYSSSNPCHCLQLATSTTRRSRGTSMPRNLISCSFRRTIWMVFMRLGMSKWPIFIRPLYHKPLDILGTNHTSLQARNFWFCLEFA